MNKRGKFIIRIILISVFLQFACMAAFAQDDISPISKKDTFYNSIADARIINMIKPGKAPRVTISLGGSYNIGHLDLAADDNASFRKDDFESGRNFGTRYGYGGYITGKFAIHKEGNVRLNVTAAYNRFLSNFVISESPQGKVFYNVFSGALGIENNFNPDKKAKPFVGLDLVVSMISGEATLISDTAEFKLKIKNAIRFGASVNLGFEYAFSNNAGIQLGYKLTYANLIGKESKTSTNPSETYLNDEKVTGETVIPYAGWKQFLYSSIFAGVNIYFGMRNKK